MSYRNVTPVDTHISTTGSAKTPRHILQTTTSSPDAEKPWSSTTPSSIHLTFPQPIIATHIALTFQGGFVPTSCAVWVARAEDQGDGRWVGLGLMMGGKVFPEDKNRRQVFEIPLPPSGLAEKQESSPGPNIVTEVPPEGQSLDNGGTVEHNTQATGASQGDVDDAGQPKLTELKLEFEKSSDQYGRVMLYAIEVLREN